MSAKTDWTIMVYMAGANNLSIDMAYALENLRANNFDSQTATVNIYAYYKNNEAETDAFYCDLTNNENPFYQNAGEFKSSDSKPGDFDSLVNFAEWAFARKNRQQPILNESQNKYAIIFSGHTLGFLSIGLLNDENQKQTLTMRELRESVKTINQKLLGKKLAILGFDSCVMSMFEIGYQFHDLAETLIASEGSIPNAGWSYDQLLANITRSPENSQQIAGLVVQEYIEQQNRYSIGGVSVDMAAWDLCRLRGLNQKFERLASSLLRCFAKQNTAVYQQLKRILLQVHFNSQTYMYDQCVDLGDFCGLLVEELASLQIETGRSLNPLLRDVKEASKLVLQEIERCIIQSGFSGGQYQYSTGISLFFPWSEPAYEVSRSDYEALNLVSQTRGGRLWNQFLKQYLSDVSRRKSENSVFDKFKHLQAFNSTVSNCQTTQTRTITNPIVKLSNLPSYSVAQSNFFEKFTRLKNLETNRSSFGFSKKIRKDA